MNIKEYLCGYRNFKKWEQHWHKLYLLTYDVYKDKNGYGAGQAFDFAADYLQMCKDLKGMNS